ncbi:MAG: ROK family protein, partial [Clostridia bacterium]|nr:ROK family protein [Clostridia bacterium]
MLYLGIDVGASNIVSAVIDESFNILGKGKAKVGKGITGEQFCELICSSAHLAADNAGVSFADCAYCGIGCPGAIDAERGVLIYAANLGLGDIALSQVIGDALGVPVFVANDANCAALGEVYAGAAVGAKNALVVTLGTGIGGGIVIDRRIYSGINGLAGEVGHMTLFPGGLQGACGRKGCWEVYASATA